MSAVKKAVATDNKMTVKNARKKQRSFASCFKRDWQLYSLLLIPLAFCIIFKYVPMGWLQIAFKDWKIKDGFFGGEWVGLEIFSKVFHHRNFLKSLRNTLLLNVLDLVVSFPMPIILALLLNEIRSLKFKKVTQTLLYLPHFLSWVIIGGLAYQLLSVNTGVVNALIQGLGGTPVNFLQENASWLVTYIIVGAWQSMGMGNHHLPGLHHLGKSGAVRSGQGGRGKQMAADAACNASLYPEYHCCPSDYAAGQDYGRFF